MENVSLGLDIGTTTISASVVNLRVKKQVQAYTVQNSSFLKCEKSFQKEQDAEIIFEKIEELLQKILISYPQISKIGITGQMHGILYVDESGKAVSPLYTWQDLRAGEPFKNGRTYVEEIAFCTGQEVGVGYGVATHFYNKENHLVPSDARKFCTVMDYIAMRLCGKNTPKIHATNAASLGLFQIESNQFDKLSIEKLGLDFSLFPAIASTNEKIGEYKNIPIFAAIGDNQASFFGAVANEENSVLVNYGTGSQISFVKAEKLVMRGFEIRPYRDNLYLYSGAAICGGRAYAIVEKFFADYLLACGIESGKQYEVMNALAQKGLEKNADLQMQTTFCGTRTEPKKTGALYNIREDNFTPENFVYATLEGMAKELFEFFLGADRVQFENLIASGNAVRLNAVFQKILSKVFSMPLFIPSINEEAAFGVALWVNANEKMEKAAAKECVVYE